MAIKILWMTRFRDSQGAERLFTGLVEEIGSVISLSAAGENSRLVISSNVVGSDAAIGDSVCVNGCCLTVVEASPGVSPIPNLAFDVIPESLQRTNLGQLQKSDCVNLERSLLPDTRLGGHFVTGHIDGLATIDAIDEQEDWRTIRFKCAVNLTMQMASKGSIAIDGISLTLVDVDNEGFSVALIPHTLTATTIGARRVGETVNIETDLLAKYVQRQLVASQNLKQN